MGVSITSCELDRSTAELATVKVERNNGLAGSYKLRYNIMMASLTGPLDVIAKGVTGAPHPLPSLWSTYSYSGDTDTHSFCKGYTVERDLKVDKRYYVTVNYEPLEPGELPDISNPTSPNSPPIKSEPNPLLRGPVFWWDREVASKTHTTNTFGAANLNFAGDFYDDLVETDQHRAVLVVEFPVASNNAFIDLSRKYDQSVNQTQWTFKTLTYPARTVLCRQVSCSPLIAEGSYRYYEVSMRFVFAYAGETWDIPVPEMGRTYFTKTNGSFDLDQLGNKKRTISEYPVPLEADGTRRSDNQPVLITKIQAHRLSDFNQLTQGNTWNNV